MTGFALDLRRQIENHDAQTHIKITLATAYATMATTVETVLLHILPCTLMQGTVTHFEMDYVMVQNRMTA